MEKWNGADRRRAARARFPYTIYIKPAAGKVISTYTEDISGSGARVVIRQKVPVGGIFEVRIYVGHDRLSCKGKVVWLREKAGSVLDGIVFYNAGIDLFDIKPEDRAILDRCVKELAAKQKSKGKSG